MSHDHGHDGGSDVRLRIQVPDMDCPSCAGKVENALDGVSGIADVSLDPATGVVRFTVTGDARRDRKSVV